MNFKSHSDLKEKHAFLSPSKYHWIKYNEDKLINSFNNYMSAQQGTRLHAFAKEAIELGIKLPRTPKTINMYINDAIGFKMKPEQILFYSENCFGTADAISFRQNFLRIHDLKNGSIRASIDQLKVYVALFCLEYGYKPDEIDIELRLYQFNQFEPCVPLPEEIFSIMETIIIFDKKIESLKSGG